MQRFQVCSVLILAWIACGKCATTMAAIASITSTKT